MQKLGESTQAAHSQIWSMVMPPSASVDRLPSRRSSKSQETCRDSGGRTQSVSAGTVKQNRPGYGSYLRLSSVV